MFKLCWIPVIIVLLSLIYSLKYLADDTIFFLNDLIHLTYIFSEDGGEDVSAMVSINTDPFE